MRAIGVILLVAIVGTMAIFLMFDEGEPRPALDQVALPIQTPSLPSMDQRLAEIATNADPTQNPYLSHGRIEPFKNALAEASTIREKTFFHQEYFKSLLNAGYSEQAIEALDAYEAFLKQDNPSFLKEHKSWFLGKRAIAYLRIGEQENCIANHHAHSCIFPIGPSGLHQLQRGSRNAIEPLKQLLEHDPQDLAAKWLLNLAYMTIGEHPDGVPAQWRIPVSIFSSDYDIKRFPDVAGHVGLDVEGLSGGSIMEDFDNDGLLDVMCSSIGLNESLRYFHNNGDGTFSEHTDRAGLSGQLGGLNIMQTDANNDGFADVFVTRGGWFGREGRHPNSLLRNNGNGTFTDVTEESGVLSFHPTQTATWFDYNNDGWLDVFIGNESNETEIHPCELYRNNQDGTFTECARQVGVAHIGLVKGVTSGDYDNDGRTDLYLSMRGEPNVLFHNDGPVDEGSSTFSWQFTNRATTAGVSEPHHSFPTWFWDYDNDGWLDLFVSDYRIANVSDVAAEYLGLPHQAERARLYRNQGDGTFEDVTQAAGLDRIVYAMGCNFGDLDNDGWLDFYVGTGDPDLGTLMPNRMFRNAQGARFQDVTTSGGFGHLQKGHGVSFGDIDNDGDQDIYQDMGGAYTGDVYRNSLYANPGHGNQWIALRLQGMGSNRPGIGSRIKITVNTAAGKRDIYKTVTTGGSFGASPLHQHIGLGQTLGIIELEVFWPTTQTRQNFKNVVPNQLYLVREGTPDLEVRSLKPFQLEPHPSTHQ